MRSGVGGNLTKLVRIRVLLLLLLTNRLLRHLLLLLRLLSTPRIPSTPTHILRRLTPRVHRRRRGGHRSVYGRAPLSFLLLLLVVMVLLLLLLVLLLLLGVLSVLSMV